MTKPSTLEHELSLELPAALFTSYPDSEAEKVLLYKFMLNVPRTGVAADRFRVFTRSVLVFYLRDNLV